MRPSGPTPDAHTPVWRRAGLVALSLVVAGVAGSRAGLRNRSAEGSRTGASSSA
ncbi:hypothetical protein AB0C70_26270 [Streptomyces sp. NPDC048564]|uniref:hypothetical protein n=1 Tax=unclassified Streptomyces TaxID=2593676 RepID=UPI0034242DF7